MQEKIRLNILCRERNNLHAGDLASGLNGYAACLGLGQRINFETMTIIM